MTNLRPADELLSVRQRIKEMQAREKVLKEGLITGGFEPVGHFALVSIIKRKGKRFDRKAAEAELGSLARFDVVTETTVVLTEALENPDAA